MSTTTTTNTAECVHCTVPADVPLPVGAETSDLWTDWNNECRVIFTPDHPVGNTDLAVYASAIQLADGTIDDGSGATHEPPRIWLGERGGMSSGQARELAATLVQLASIVDQWTGQRLRVDTRLSTVRAALLEALQPVKRLPGNAGDYLQAALDSIDEVIEVTR